MEGIKLLDKRICAACDSETTSIRIGKRGNIELWNYHDGHILCNRCWRKYVYSPISHQQWNRIHFNRYSKRRILFREKRIILNENPRKGTCYNCGRNNGRTEIHHIEYHDNDPLKDTVELCDRCHGLTKR